MDIDARGSAPPSAPAPRVQVKEESSTAVSGAKKSSLLIVSSDSDSDGLAGLL